jgi:hypothetical protein
MKKIYLLISFLVLILLSCVTQTVDDFSSFTVQLPIFFTSDYPNRAAPDTSVDFSTLYKYKEYKDNKGKIDKSEIYQFNYRIDSLVLQNGKNFDPATDNIVFEYIKFKLVFAKPKYNEESLDSNDFTMDKSKGEYLLGEYKNADMKDYYKQSKNIIGVSDSISVLISELLKNNPYFFIITEYSKIKGSNQQTDVFPFIRAKFDIVVRLKITL